MSWPSVPRWIVYVALVAVVVSWLPLALIARARAVRSGETRVHIFQDMDVQPKLRPQALAPIFADHRGMRPVVPGTVARGDLREDDHLYQGKVNGEWATTFPMPVTEAVVRRGQERFNIFCSTCHGLGGAGNGPTHQRAVKLQEPAWVPPTSLLSDTVVQRQHGHLFNTITNGIRNMAAYGTQIPVEDRWAIVAYIRALQLSRNADLSDVPADQRDALR